MLLQLILVQTKAFQIVYQGIWGDWNNLFKAPQGYYLCGGKMRFQDPVGEGDDTAANGLQCYFCKFSDWNDQTSLAFLGIWGSWKNKVMCPYQSYVIGFQVRFEGNQGEGDDSALNGLRFLCRDFGGNENLISIYEGVWGNWQDIIRLPSAYLYIQGFAVRFQGNQGKGDDSAMNGLYFQANEYKPYYFYIDYKLPQRYELPPQIINMRQTINCMNVSTNQTISFEKTVETYKQFINYRGYLTGMAFSSSVNFQVFYISAMNSLQLRTEKSQNFTFGIRNTTTIKYTDSISVQCPAKSKCRTFYMINLGNLSIPYEIRFRFPRGQTARTNGTFSGVLASRTYKKTDMSPANTCS